MLATYFARNQDVLQRDVASFDPSVIHRILCLGLAYIMVISSMSFGNSLPALELTD